MRYFFISSKKPFAMKMTMMRTIIATMTQTASIGMVPKKVSMLYTPLLKHRLQCQARR